MSEEPLYTDILFTETPIGCPVEILALCGGQYHNAERNLDQTIYTRTPGP